MWDITPLNVATLNLTRVASIARVGHNADAGGMIQIPDVAWLMKNTETGRVILVDSGPCDPEHANKFHSPIEKTPEQELEYQLRINSVEPEDIDTVLLTHLHWDHGYGIYKLPNAKVYVQRRELQYAIAPYAIQKGAYELNDTSKPPYFFEFFHRIIVVDGDMEFCEGVKLLTLPGHSPGSQGVLVQGDGCRYLMTGDLLYNMDNLNEQAPTGVYTSLDDYYNSFQRIRNLGSDIVLLPGHDYNVFEILKK